MAGLLWRFARRCALWARRSAAGAFALSKDEPMRQVSLGLELIGIKC